MDATKSSGVYAIINTVNGKMYVGSTAQTFQQRWKTHRNELLRGVHGNRHLSGAWQLYGPDVFQWFILETCTPENCIEREQFWIDHFDSANGDRGYNLSPTAGSILGVRFSAEAKARMSLAQRGKKMSAEARESIRRSITAYWSDPVIRATRNRWIRTPEEIEKSAAQRRGRRMSESAKMALSLAQCGKKPTAEQMAGLKKGWVTPKSDETRRKLSAAKLGRKHSDETRASMSAAGKKRVAQQRRSGTGVFAEVQRRKAADSSRGRTHTEESREKMRQKWIKRKESGWKPTPVKQTPDSIQKSRLKRIGTKRTEDTKAKLRLAWIRRKQRKAQHGKLTQRILFNDE